MSVSQTSRLINMTKWAKERKEYISNKSPNSWHEDWYIRIGGTGFTAISLNDKTPLNRFGSGAVTDIKILEELFAGGITVSELDREKKTKNSPEHRAQAWLIKQALNNKIEKLDFKESLGIKDNDIYQKLFFALDEVRIVDDETKSRTDIMAVGVYCGVAYPVLVELKWGRKLTGEHALVKQLEKYGGHLKQYEREFKPLLEACIGGKVDFSKVGKIMVWPGSSNGNSSKSVGYESQKNSITVIQSKEPDWSNIPWSALKDSPFQIFEKHQYPPQSIKS
jgi:hypothetical protein